MQGIFILEILSPGARYQSLAAQEKWPRCSPEFSKGNTKRRSTVFNVFVLNGAPLENPDLRPRAGVKNLDCLSRGFCGEFLKFSRTDRAERRGFSLGRVLLGTFYSHQ